MNTWFSNATVYRLARDYPREEMVLAGMLYDNAHEPCSGVVPATVGWARPAGRLVPPKAAGLVRQVNGATLICLRREEALLPPDVIREAVEERIETIEDAEGRTVRAKERKRIRDEIIFELLPRAFRRTRDTYAYLDHHAGYLIVNTASPKRAEEVLLFLGHALPDFVIDPLEADTSMRHRMTAWVDGRDQLPAGFEVTDKALHLEDAEGGKVVCKNEDTHDDAVQTMVRDRKLVTRLSLDFEERVSFVLDDELRLRQLRFLAVDEVDAGDDASDMLARLDANFAFMVGELRNVLTKLHERLCTQEPLAGRKEGEAA